MELSEAPIEEPDNPAGPGVNSAGKELTCTGPGPQTETGLPLDQNPAAIYLASLRPTGRRTMRQALDVMAAELSGGRDNALTLDWPALRYQHTVALRAVLAGRYKPATANKMLSALRRVLKEAWRLGQLDAEAYRRAIDLPSVRGQSLPKGRALGQPEIAVFLKACAADTSPIGLRDAAMLAVLYSSGLRRSEVVQLNLADYDTAGRSLTVREGKGGKDRITYLSKDASRVLGRWVVARGHQAGPLFCQVNKHGQVVLKRLTGQAVLFMLSQRAKEAGMDKFSPHDLRRTFISNLLDKGADIATVQKLAGHASVTTTARYDRRGEEARRKAADLLSLPGEAEE